MKKLQISSPNNFQVHVLLQELYPDQGANLATALRRYDRSSVDDYLQSFHKFGLDECGDLQLDEINFLFQTNNLPISVFQGNSIDSEGDSQLISDMASSSTEMAISTPSPQPSSNVHALISHTDVSSSHSPITFNKLLIGNAEPISSPEKKQGLYEDANTNIVISNSNRRKNPETKQSLRRRNLSSTNPLLLPNFPYPSNEINTNLSITKSSVYPGGLLSCKHNNGSDISAKIYRENRDAELRITRSASLGCEESQKGALNLPIALKPVVNTSRSINSSNIPYPKLKNRSARKSVLTCLSNQINKESSRNCPCPLPKFHTLMSKNVKKECLPQPTVDYCNSSNSEDSDFSFTHDSDPQYHPCSPLKVTNKNRLNSEEIISSLNSSLKKLAYCSSEGSSTTGAFISSELSDSDCTERHIRDVDIMIHFGVPFTYDEVAHCSNEKFRQMKSFPDLTSEQLTAMVNARRRATNRRAAERGRRIKSVARIQLESQLEHLRLQTRELSNTIIRVRRRRQQARDELSSAQHGLFKLLVGPDGNYLDSALWRIQTTLEGELVLVRAI